MPYTAFLPCLHAYVESTASDAARKEKKSKFREWMQHEILVKDDEHKESSYGIAILSRYEILEMKTLLFSRKENSKSQGAVSGNIDMDKDEQPRGALAVLLEIPKADQDQDHHHHHENDVKRMWVVNTHISHKICSEEQRSHAKELTSWINSFAVSGMDTNLDTEKIARKHAMILCGDLNSPVSLPRTGLSVIMADGKWTDLWNHHGTYDNSATMPSSVYKSKSRLSSFFKPMLGMRIDYILSYRSEDLLSVICNEIKVLNEGGHPEASDHCAVWADLHLS